MLDQVLAEIESTNGTISLHNLALKLNIEQSALEGMLNFWVRKGRLNADDVLSGTSSECYTSGCGGCAGVAQCPFVVQIPHRYEIKSNI